ncbi:hypothetical protein M758_UG185300 [Ceratodon purpureus]|nr:hypothetical protein M758_UG185300 [Ceratodon purpureus]
MAPQASPSLQRIQTWCSSFQVSQVQPPNRTVPYQERSLPLSTQTTPSPSTAVSSCGFLYSDTTCTFQRRHFRVHKNSMGFPEILKFRSSKFLANCDLLLIIRELEIHIVREFGSKNLL